MHTTEPEGIDEATVMQHERAALAEITKAQYVCFRSTQHYFLFDYLR